MKTNTFNKIYNENYNIVLNYVNYKVQNLFVTEEIVNDVFLKLNKYPFNESKGAKISTWLRTLANSCILDYYRLDKSNMYQNVSDFVNEDGLEIFQFKGDSNADKDMNNGELKSAIMRAFATLKPKYQCIATLYFLEEKEYKEIAEIVEIPINSVKVMILRCREMLQKKLKNVTMA